MGKSRNLSKSYTDSEIDSDVINAKAGRKNLIINGGFDVWQRGTSFSVLGNQYTADRWTTVNGVQSGTTVSKVSSGGGVRWQGSASNVTADGFEQRIENGSQPLSAVDFVTASFDLTVTTADAGAKVYLWNYGTASYIGGTGTLLPTTSGKVEVTFDVSAVNYDDGIVSFSLWLGTGDYTINNVQLELGSQATDFEYRSYGEELALCQRYFTIAYNSEPYHIGFVYNNNSVSVSSLSFPVEMRTTPSFTAITPSHITTAGNWGIYGATNGWMNTGYTPGFASSSANNVQIQFGGVLGLSNGSTYICSGGFIADAEL